MTVVKMFDKTLVRFAGLVLGIALLVPNPVQAALEQTFEVLQVGTSTYHNVTVTTKTKNYVFLIHSNGMASVKITDLSPELRAQLGYENSEGSQSKTKATAVWAKQTLSKLDAPQVQQVRAQLAGLFARGQPISRLNAIPITRNVLLIGGAILAALYLFHCYCCLLICRKSGVEPGPLIWLPILQIFPLLKAARMSPWWFLGLLVPVLNLIGQILWCIKIADARGKALIVGLLLIFPLTSPFAVLYLAFSAGPRPRKENRRVEIMTLEAA